MRFLSSVVSVCILLLLAGIVGCRSDAVPSNQIATSEAGFELALTLIESNNYADALSALDSAINSGGGLNPDLVTEAYIARALCHVQLGDVTKAEADIEVAEGGVGGLAQLLVVRGLIARKKGDESSAEQFFSRAREVDPNVKIPK